MDRAVALMFVSFAPGTSQKLEADKAISKTSVYTCCPDGRPGSFFTIVTTVRAGCAGYELFHRFMLEHCHSRSASKSVHLPESVV